MNYASLFMSGAFCAVTGVAAAQGCGPMRLKVTESVALDVPPAKVWAVVGDFQNMSWNGLVVKSNGQGGNQPEKAHRLVSWRGGTNSDESLYKYDAAAMSYSYHVDRGDVRFLPVQNLSATLEVLPREGGAKSLVRWRAAFYRNLAPGEGAPDAADRAASQAVELFVRVGLDGLKAKFAAKS